MEEPPDHEIPARRRQHPVRRRAIVTGGYQALPKVEMPGAMLIGDSAGLLNVPKIKGTHQAIRPE
jgi:flavin-dependent dehydrogenase